MDDARDYLLTKYREHNSQARQHENLRAMATNFIIAIAGAVLVFVRDQDPEIRATAGIFLLVIGTFGALMSYKHYERFRYHKRYAREIDKRLREREPADNLEHIDEIESRHKERFGWIARTRLYQLWVFVHLFVALLGIYLAVSMLIPVGCRCGS